MDNNTILAILFTIIIAILFCILLFLFTVPINRLFRWLYLHKLARRLKLQFQSNFLHFQINHGQYSKNIIKGNLNGHLIEICDLYNMRKYHSSNLGLWAVFLFGYRYTSTEQVTIIKVDGQETRIKGSFYGFASVRKIKQLLLRIKDSPWGNIGIRSLFEIKGTCEPYPLT